MDYKNSEGYPDPTCYEALKNIEAEERRSLKAFRPIVYICSPYAGDVERNVEAARRFCRFATEQGYIPLAPHLLFPQFLDDDDETERSLGLFFGNALMSKCAEVWVFGDRISRGWKRKSNVPGGKATICAISRKTARRFDHVRNKRTQQGAG
jgi:hypothetical protein